MSRATGSLQELLVHMVGQIEQRPATLWIGDEASALSISSGHRLLRRIARVTHHALSPMFSELPTIDKIADALQSLGSELALSLADRSIGRTQPLLLEDPFDGRRARLPAWESLLWSSLKGHTGYLHRAIIALVRAGYVGRIVTANQDELLEQAARQLDVRLPVVHALEGDRVPEAGAGPYLLKLHGTWSRPGPWPLDLHRLHLSRHSAVIAGLGELLEQDPLLVLGYPRPEPLDIAPVLNVSRLGHAIWAEEDARGFKVTRLGEELDDPQLEGGVSGPQIEGNGGWRVWGRLPLLLEAICDHLGVAVGGPSPDEEVTAVRELDDLWPSSGEDRPLPPALQPLGEELRGRWVGAFALITWLELWSEPALEDIFSRSPEIEAQIASPKHRAFFQYLLAQTGRSEVEAALARHFRGEPVPALRTGSARKMERAVSALETLSGVIDDAPVNADELNVERSELRFALSGSVSWLPASSQVIAEIPSVTHAERWLRLKAAGAVCRRQWSVAIHELSRALAEGMESGAPLMKLRARVGLAGVLTHLLGAAEPAPLVGCLKALKRSDRGLATQVIDRDTAPIIGLALTLRLLDETLEGFGVFLPTLQPPLEPIFDDFLRLALRAYGEDAPQYLFDREIAHGRSYAYLPHIEKRLGIRYVEARQVRLHDSGQWSNRPVAGR